MGRRSGKTRTAEPDAGKGRSASLADQGPPPARDRLAALAVCVFLLAAVVLIFFPTFHYGYVNFDDDDYVHANRHVRKGLTAGGVAWAFTQSHAHNWHPLTWLSHMVDCAIFGVDRPGWHHLTNVLLHAATAIALFLVLRRMTGRLWPSAAVAALFAVHPLRVESVAWISERKDVLSGLLFMLVLAAYVGYAARPGSWPRYLLVLLLFALGLMAKPMLVTVPFVLLILDYWPLGRGREKGTGTVCRNGPSGALHKRCLSPFPATNGACPLFPNLIVEKLPFLALVLASCAATLYAQRAIVQEVERLPLPFRAGNAVVSYAMYLVQMVCPANLAAIYPHPKENLPGWQVAAALLLLAGISAMAIVWRKNRPYLLVGWLWYLGMLVPVIGLVQVGLQARADRYTYLPQIGIAWMIVWGLTELSAAWPYRQWLAGLASAAVLAGLSVAARQQTQHWADGKRLWTHTITVTAPNPTAHGALAEWLINAGQPDEAEAELRRALEIEYKNGYTHRKLGLALARQAEKLGLAGEAGQKKLDEAIAAYQYAIKIFPNFPAGHNDLGKAFWEQRKITEAKRCFERALYYDPRFADAHNNLGYLLLEEGHVDQAVAHFHEALKSNPDLALAHFNLGNAFGLQGKLDEAIGEFEQSLKSDPQNMQAHKNLAYALKVRGRTTEALEHYQQALALALAKGDQAAADSIRHAIERLGPGRPPPSPSGRGPG